LDIQRAGLVGYSMGAAVAALVAAGDDRIDRLVLGGVGAGMVEVGGLDRREVPADQLIAALLAETAPPPDTQPGAFRAFADLVGADRLALAAQVRAPHPDRIPLEQLKIPTLVLAGAADPLAARPQVLADAIAGATLTVLPGDHLGVVRDPGFVPAIVGFLG
jgi:pimeloyl-ACP methyl ester carboxylesterase